MDGGFSDLRSSIGNEQFVDEKRQLVRQIDAPVPPLIIHLQRVRTNLTDNGTLEYVNVECWSSGVYECREEFAVLDMTDR